MNEPVVPARRPRVRDEDAGLLFERWTETVAMERELDQFHREDVAGLGTRLEELASSLDAREQLALQALIEIGSGEAPFLELRRTPAEAILDDDELKAWTSIRRHTPSEPVLPEKVHVIVKATRLCNLRCTYCNYWREGPNQIMRFRLLAQLMRDAVADPGVKDVEFIWHGGEPTLLPVAFYRKALWLQEQFRQPGQVIRNRMQTNATRIPPEFLDLWRRFRFIVGVSLDGPAEIHDLRRIDKVGRPTSAAVRAGLAQLRAAGIDPRILMVCDRTIVDAGAERVFAHLLEVGVTRVGLLNVVPDWKAGDDPDAAYLPWPDYVRFLDEMFRLWWPEHRNDIVLRELATLAGQIAGREAALCNFQGGCFGRIFTVEPTGEVAACDRFVGDPGHEYGTLGGLERRSLQDLVHGPMLAEMSAANDADLTRLTGCEWFDVCNGGCPHDRELIRRYEPGLPSGCCGLAPLLSSMRDHMVATGSMPHRGEGRVAVALTARPPAPT